MRGLRLPALAVMAVAALALAGCSGGKGKGDMPASEGDPQDLPGLHGFVFDPALRPLVGATVKVLDTNASTQTDKEGFFGFAGLPTEQFLVVVATMDGYVPTSKQVSLSPTGPVRLNFTLSPVPTKVAYTTTLKQDLLVECQVGLTVANNDTVQSCSTGTTEVDTWDIPADVNLAGAVVEVFWDPVTAGASSVGAKLETLDLGKLNLLLGEVRGESPLRILVPQTTAERYYPQGGLMHLSVYAAPNTDELEAGVGATVLLQQPLTAYATLFYVTPPDPSYTIGEQ